MVFYILRHEQRNLAKPGFFTPLTMVGEHNAKIKLYSQFKDKNIDAIYSSPYKRTLDTVSHLALEKNLSLKIDWSISEKVSCEHLSDIVWPTNAEQNKLHNLYIRDESYIPITDIDYITTYEESIDSYLSRVDAFCKFIQTQKDKDILIVSHQSVTTRIIENLANLSYQLEMGEYYEIK